MNATIIRLALQALLGRRRFWLLLLMPLVMIALAVVVRTLAGEGAGYEEILVGLGLGLVLPLVALLTTSSALGPEMDDGSIVYLLAKPVSRHAIAASKYAVALLATLGFGVLPLLVAGFVLDASRGGATVAWFVGGVLAAAAYCGLFLAVSAVTKHAVVVGLLFLLVWEGLLGNLLSGVRWLSIGNWAGSLADSLSDRAVIHTDGVGAAYALVATAVVVLGGVWFAGDRLRSFSLRGDT
ncbi:ABC transporter permease [Nocardioides sp.]|uniref:ABC transporter permease n=1 Tax=Nocardioides sp. TaxID=35761 RepID=UPI003526D244